MTESIVRMASPADEQGLLKHCQMHNAETGVYGLSQDFFPLDDQQCLETIRRGTQRNYGLIGVIGPVGGELEASIGLVMSRVWWSTNWHIDELWTFVHPDKRKSKHAQALSKFAKECSRELGIPLIGGLIANEKTEQKLRFYQRHYGYPKGAYFVFNPKDAEAEPDQKTKRFWRHPFPEPGVAVIETKGLSVKDLDLISKLKTRMTAAAPA